MWEQLNKLQNHSGYSYLLNQLNRTLTNEYRRLFPFLPNARSGSWRKMRLYSHYKKASPSNLNFSVFLVRYQNLIGSKNCFWKQSNVPEEFQILNNRTLRKSLETLKLRGRFPLSQNFRLEIPAISVSNGRAFFPSFQICVLIDR